MAVNVKSFSKAKGTTGNSSGGSIIRIIKSSNTSNGYLNCVNSPGTTSMTVVAGSTSIGTRNVVRADSDYYDYDVIILKNLSNEVWIKLPTDSGASGKNLKIKNLSGQNCYVYVQDTGYKIYAPDNTNYASYYNIGNGATELVWTGNEWIWFRCN